MRTRLSVLLLALLSLFTGCGGDEETTGPVVNDLVGSWDAVEIELIADADPPIVVELISLLGANGRLVLEANGDFGLSVGIPGEPTEFAGGTWGATNVLTLAFDSGDIEGTWVFNYVLNGDNLTMTGAAAEYDFDGDDIDDAAFLNMQMVRL